MNEIDDKPRTIGEKGARIWVYPQEVSGRFNTLRNWVAMVLLVFYYALPWATVGGSPLVRLSFLSGHFYVLGQKVLMYDFYHFVILLLLLVVTLFLASALLGRIWCGYACPQTIFIEQILRRIERWVEGNALHRKTEDAKNKGLTGRKILKHFLFLVVSLSFSLTFVMIFTGPEEAFYPTTKATPIAIFLLTLLAWFDGGYWREQFCHVVCPYARFQSVMVDKHTRLIGYDERRGEPRRRGKDRNGAGDCIDCGMCVRVCPSNIDIRQGVSQLECISCTRCIDACDTVMTNIGKPTGLIRYDVEQNLNAALDKSQHVKGFVRPRTLLYVAIWLALFGVGVWQFVNRNVLHVQILNVSGGAPFYVQDGQLKNLWTLKIGNTGAETESYEITVVEGQATVESQHHTPEVEMGSEIRVPLLLSSKEIKSTHVKLRIRGVKTGEIRYLERDLLAP